MNIIKSVDQLPEWFKRADYKKNLSAADWYREIKKREWATEQIRIAVEKHNMPSNRPLTLFRACYKKIRKNWECYYQYGIEAPIRDMTKAQAIFLSAYNDSEMAREFFDSAKILIEHFKHEIKKGGEALSPEYEDRLSFFLDDWHNLDYPQLDDMAYRIVYDTGNPMLHYCRPFVGYPVVIDTAFDDETLISQFKLWLSEVRKYDEPKAKRPFTANDFSDWAQYRVREIYDLELWASLTGTRIQDRVIALALWPHAADNFSPLDVLRTTARKKVNELFNSHISQRLYGQLVLEFGENFLEE